MKAILIILLIVAISLLVESRMNDQYQAGYKDGMKTALKTNPPSEELEMACVGLWVGEQNKRYWQKNALR
jgi:hypothetical protein